MPSTPAAEPTAQPTTPEVKTYDKYFRDGTLKPTAADTKLSGYHGGDEDDIMEKIIKEYSVNALDSTYNKTEQLMLSKKAARRAAEVALEACHKLTEAEVPAYIAKNFEPTFDYFDQNNEGFIRYEESFQFLR